MAFGFLAKPQLRYCLYEEEGRWKVRVINRNVLGTSVKELKCEIALSKDKNFTYSKTLDLVKDHTFLIQAFHQDEYIFKCEKTIQMENPTNDYTHIRVRLIVPNFLGIRKVFSRIEKLSELPLDKCMPHR